MTRHWPNIPRLLELRRWVRWRYLTREGWRLRRAGRGIGLHLRSEERFRGMRRPRATHRRQP